MRRGTEKELSLVGAGGECEHAVARAALSATVRAMETMPRSTAGAVGTTIADELSTCCDGKRRCSAGLSGSSVAAWVLTAMCGSSKTRSITRSAVVHAQTRRVIQPIARM